MASFDFLILIVYITLMVYVLYRARQSVLDDRVSRREEARAGKVLVFPRQEILSEELERQLDPLNLSTRIKINLGGPILTEGDRLDRLNVSIENRTTTYAVYINWSESTLTDLRSQSRSLARISPNEGLSQNISMVPPQQQFRENLTVWTGDRPLPLLEPFALMSKVDITPEGEKACAIVLSLSIGLKAVSNSQANHFIAVSCPIEFRAPSLDDIHGGGGGKGADLQALLQGLNR